MSLQEEIGEPLSAQSQQIVGTGDMTSLAVRGKYTRDAMGRVVLYEENPGMPGSASYTRFATYNARSQVSSDVVTTIRLNPDTMNYDTYVGTTTYCYSASEISTGVWEGVATGGAYMGGTVTRSSTYNTRNGADDDLYAKDTSTVERLSWADGAVQVRTAYDKDTDDSDGPWLTTYSRDGSGYLTSASIDDERDRTVTFKNDAEGRVLQRDEADGNSTAGDPRELRYYFNGIRVGDISNNGTSNTDYATSIALHTKSPQYGAFRFGATAGTSYADFDQSYDAINGLTYEATSTRYTATGGETLAMVAQSVWGDAALWYLIADANGLTGSETIAAGTSLIIPNKVHNVHNNAETWRPYDPNEATGDLSPTDAKKPKENDCAVLGQIFLVAIAVALSAWLGPHIIGAMQSVLGSFAGAVVGGAITGAGASIASQVVGLATGLQTGGFNWKSVALAAIAGGVSGGLSEIGNIAKAADGFTKVGDTLVPVSKFSKTMTEIGRFIGQNGFAGGAIRGVISSVVTQGVGRVTGLQKDFDFAGVAAAGVGGAVTAGLGLRGTVGNALNGAAGGIANAATRSLVTGTDFGDNLMAALPDVIGATIGDAFFRAVSGSGSPGVSREDSGDSSEDTGGSGPTVEMPGGSCFVAGTLVRTDRGMVAIDAIKEGHLVYARDEKDIDAGVKLRRVTKLHRHENKRVLELAVCLGNGNVQRIVATAEHPFWVMGNGWVEAAALLPGSELTLIDGLSAKVQSTTPTNGLHDVYNITVEECHTYFVTEVGVWVHNKPAQTAPLPVEIVENPKLKPFRVKEDVDRWETEQLARVSKMDARRVDIPASREIIKGYASKERARLLGTLRNQEIQPAQATASAAAASPAVREVQSNNSAAASGPGGDVYAQEVVDAMSDTDSGFGNLYNIVSNTLGDFVDWVGSRLTLAPRIEGQIGATPGYMDGLDHNPEDGEGRRQAIAAGRDRWMSQVGWTAAATAHDLALGAGTAVATSPVRVSLQTADGVSGLVNAAGHPVQTISGLAQAARNPWSPYSPAAPFTNAFSSGYRMTSPIVDNAAFFLIPEAFAGRAAESRLLPSGVGGTGAAYNKASGQGLYVLRDEAGNVRYIGRGDAPARVATHADSIDKGDLIAQTLYTNNLTKAQAKGLEQRLINQFGGASKHFPDTPLLNQINSYRSANPNAPLYRDAVTDALWQDALKKVGR